jgi:hypothetical protein
MMTRTDTSKVLPFDKCPREDELRHDTLKEQTMIRKYIFKLEIRWKKNIWKASRWINNKKNDTFIYIILICEPSEFKANLIN